VSNQIITVRFNFHLSISNKLTGLTTKNDEVGNTNEVTNFLA
jgi:hypothetical protein